MPLSLSLASPARLDRHSNNRLTIGLRTAVVLALTVLAVNFFAPSTRGEELVASQDAEVLTRGPVHDAFAMPVGLDPVAGIVVPQQPPADIEELPPEIAVEDPNAEWITGYWNWDEERNDFIWISGVWRVAPPDHRWVAGYWTEVQGGFQRISGFWAPIEVRQIVYYPQPPQSLEAGPNSPQPSPNYFWVPGNWVYTDGRYLWRGGYWAVSQENWVWMPAYYVRTPGGYIYNAGYWDYPLDNRGMMFAPVYINQTVYSRPNYYYSPSVVIRAASLLVHLFARPSYGCYYFGDYYGPTYATAGYQPWFSAVGPRGGMRWYDPIYTYQRSRHARDPNWNRQLRERYEFYASNQDARPPRTFAEQRRFASTQGPNRDRDEFRNAIMATSVADVINNVSNTTIVNNTIVNKSIDKDSIKNITNVDIRRVQSDERRSIQKQSLEVKQFAKQRSQVERQGRAVAGVNVGPNNGGPNNTGPNADPNRGPRPAGPGGNVAADVQAPALTLPELPVGERGNRGRGPGNTASPDNTTRPGNAAGPGNVVGPNDRPKREGRPERPDANRPERPDSVAGPAPNLPNGVNPDADRPQTGRPADMPPGRRTGSALPGSDTPENPAIPPVARPDNRPRPGQSPNPGQGPNRGPGVTPMPSGTPGLPGLPGVGEQPRDPRGPNPRNPGAPNKPGLPGNPGRPGGVDPSPGVGEPKPVPLPRPTLPNPSATSPKLRIPDQPRSVEQPRTEQPRNREQPGNPNRPNFGEQPRPGNGAGRGNRPDGGQPGNVPRINVPGAGGPNVNRESPMPKPKPEARPQPVQKERPPKAERPQPGPDSKPDRGPKVKAPDAPQTPPGAEPDGTDPKKKKKKD